MRRVWLEQRGVTVKTQREEIHAVRPACAGRPSHRYSPPHYAFAVRCPLNLQTPVPCLQATCPGGAASGAGRRAGGAARRARPPGGGSCRASRPAGAAVAHGGAAPGGARGGARCVGGCLWVCLAEGFRVVLTGGRVSLLLGSGWQQYEHESERVRFAELGASREYVSWMRLQGQGIGAISVGCDGTAHHLHCLGSPVRWSVPCPSRIYFASCSSSAGLH